MTAGCCSDSNVLKPSELNRKIMIEHFTTIDVDPEGIAVEGWSPLVSLRANRKPLSGREFFEAAAVNAEKTVKYRIRYRKGIKANMRLFDVLDGLYYNIVVPLDDYFGDRTQTHLMCEVLEDGQ